MVEAELRKELVRLRKSRKEARITSGFQTYQGTILSISGESVWVTKDETDKFIPLKTITAVSAVS